jgi:EAL domain-containing protein (putative c-di-GMP-specific phosphodiesterase class I)
VRWNHPIRGPIGPLDFIAEAEKDSAIFELGGFVLRQACRDALNWPDLILAVNISSYQLLSPEFHDFVVKTVGETGFPLSRLEFEIVESAVIHNFEAASATIARLREIGVKFALDDFGTGYSSLTYLRKLPLDKLKIDKTFVDDIGVVQSAAIIQAVIAMARALGLKVTAEGVETAAQQKFLRICGCHDLQGFLFSKPVSALEITRLLAKAAHSRKAG